jgi:hypothetical protein
MSENASGSTGLTLGFFEWRGGSVLWADDTIVRDCPESSGARRSTGCDDFLEVEEDLSRADIPCLQLRHRRCCSVQTVPPFMFLLRHYNLRS